MEGGVHHLLAAAVRPARTQLTSTNHPCDTERSLPGAVGAGADPSTSGNAVTRRDHENRPDRKKTGTSQPVTSHARPLNH